jgi:phage terminase Nu1 subunit (DNA packaging protein)
LAQIDTRLITQAEYSRHRNCSREAVRKAVEAGRITTFGPEKLIDAELADTHWARNTRARMRNSETADKETIAAPVIHANEVGANTSYEEARRRRELAEASIAEMKQAELEGLVIRADAVRAAWAAKVTTARDALLQIPSRLAPVLAAESDLIKTTQLLEDAVRQALAELSTEKA